MTAFSDLTQQDLDVRLQLINCCIGEKTADLLAKIKIGAKTVPCNLQELQVMQEMIEILKCYDVTLEEVLATGSVTMNSSTPDTIINVSIGGISISGDLVITTSDTNAQTAILCDLINSFQSTYTAVLNTDNVQYVIELTGTCTNQLVTVESEDTIVIEDLEGGVCLTDNCLTEVQVQAMFNWMAKKCGICFQPPGFDYES